MDGVIFAHKPRLLVITAQLQRSAHAALGLAVKCALKVTSQVATPGAESAVDDCLVLQTTADSRS